MIDDDGVGRSAVHVQLARYVREANALALEDLLQVLVQVDELFLLRVLQLVVLDVLPQSLYDRWPRGRVYAQQLGQSHVQFKLWWLIIIIK